MEISRLLNPENPKKKFNELKFIEFFVKKGLLNNNSSTENYICGICTDKYSNIKELFDHYFKFHKDNETIKNVANMLKKRAQQKQQKQKQ